MIRYISIAAIALAGLVHLIIAPGQVSHAPAHGWFFAVAGVAQLTWAVAFWRSRSSQLGWVGMALSGGLIVLWMSTRGLPAPFEPNPHAVDWALMATKFSELIGFVALFAYTQQARLPDLSRGSTPRLLAGSLGVAVLFGAFFWGSGHVADVLFPYLGHDDAHQSDLVSGDLVNGADGLSDGGVSGQDHEADSNPSAELVSFSRTGGQVMGMEPAQVQDGHDGHNHEARP